MSRQRARRRWAPRWMREVLRRPSGVYGFVVLAAVLVAAAVSFVWTPHPLTETDVSAGWRGPSPQHLLGTDLVGRDIFSWLLAGSRITVGVVTAATVLTAVVGLTLGAVTALAQRRWAEPLVVVVDVLVAFPVLLVAILFAAPFGGSLRVVVAAVALGAGVNVARVIRPEILRVSQSDFVLAARANGLGPVARFVQHVVPNVGPVAVVQLSQAAATTILAEVGLTFLGYGASASTPSWGRSLANAQTFIGVAPLSVLWPGLTVAATVLALNLFGDALREALDPRLRAAEPLPAAEPGPADAAARTPRPGPFARPVGEADGLAVGADR